MRHSRLWQLSAALVVWVGFAGCGPATPPVVTGAGSSNASLPRSTATTAESLRAQATVAEADGVLDVAAELRRRAIELAPSPEAKLAWARTLERACAFERARGVLAELHQPLQAAPASVSAAGAEPDVAHVERALTALAAKDAKAAREALAPGGARPATPFELELLGRAEWALGDHVQARTHWSCARSRIDAAGGHLGIVATAAGAITSMNWRDGRLLVARARERYLVGGYQSSRTHSMWVEQFVPGDRDPLVRFAVGNLDGFDVSPDGRSVSLIDRPVDQIVAPVPTTARLLDTSTGRELAAWPAADMRNLRYTLDAKSLLVQRQHDVIEVDLAGTLERTFALAGTTPGVIRAYRVGGQHDTIPMAYPTAPAVVVSAPDGTVVVGASDGTLWVWSGSAKAGAPAPPPFALKGWPNAPTDDREAMRRSPIAMSLDAAAKTLLVVRMDGGIVSWDLATRHSRIVAEPRCTDAEVQSGVYGSSPASPDTLAQCAQARAAAISPARSRVVLGSLMSAARVRDASDGHALAVLDTLQSDSVAFADAQGARAWLGGVEGTVTEWDTSTGKSMRELAQGGVNGFVHGLSGDGRFVAIADMVEGYHTRPTTLTHVWDTAARHIVLGLPAFAPGVRFAADRAVMVATTEDGRTALWDLTTAKPLTTLDAKSEGGFELSADGARIVGVRAGGHVVVHDMQRALRTIDVGATPWSLAIDRGAHTLAAVTESDELTVWNLDDGRNLLRASVPRGSPVALSPEGGRVAWRSGPTELVVTSVADHRDIARLASKDLAADQDYQPIRAGEFVNEDTLLVVGPGQPGYERVYRWKISAGGAPGSAFATELQVLGGERMQIGSNGVAIVYDRNDMAHLLRIADGVLLASVSATRGGGWIAESRAGAVDGPPDGQAALVTIVDGAPLRIAGSSWLAWDRYAVPGLLQRAGSGQVVMPPIAGTIAWSDTLAPRAAPH